MLIFKFTSIMSVMKAQVSIEFFTYFSLTALALAIMVSSVADRQAEVSEFKESSLASNIGEKIAFEIQQAKRAGTNYTRNITLPDSILGDSYNVSLKQNIIIVKWEKSQVTTSSTVKVQNQQLENFQSTTQVLNNGSVFLSE